MDELLDVLNSQGNLIGQTAMKSVVHRVGLYHQTVHIWFYTDDGQVLFQQRGKNKNIHPLLWDASVAGHIGAGESVETAAIREIEEEIGIVVSTDDLEKVGVFKSKKEHHNGLKDFEFHHTFLCHLRGQIEDLGPQESEVEALKMMTMDDFNSEVLKRKNAKKYVPHAKEYYEEIYKEISNRLK